MSEDESTELSASTSERFCFLLTPDMIHDATQLSLEVIKEEREDVKRTILHIIDHMSVRSPQDPEWHRASEHLQTLGARLRELGALEDQALTSYAKLGTHRTSHL